MKLSGLRGIILFIVFILGFGIWNLEFESCIAAPPVRIKDMASVLGARENQIMGFGLIVGLKNTGDSVSTGFTQQAMNNLLSKMGMAPQIDFKSRNVAAVMVTCNLPPFIRSGQKMDVTVSSVGDATSLGGGTLLLTPLQGPDGNVYATAQGNISIDYDTIMPNLSTVRKNHATTGRIPGGALVEREVPVTIAEQGFVSIVLDEPDFTTADRVAIAIEEGGYAARAIDAGTINVTVLGTEDALRTIADIENITVVPDSIAKVVISERTGTIVMGENVKISEVAVSYGGINVTVGPVNLYSEGHADAYNSASDTMRIQTNVNLSRSDSSILLVPSSSRLSTLVKALNAIKAKPQELIAILQAMKKVGSLKAELEII
ncbi:hypothetical protein A2230_01695 [candidate division WOR-1 bacterium RIFOXYA2_FULL_36_21]|uniref:Flagellar P-ring protein n=1 Tax=candidate division WOR-1 bacterium RIFOXYB2_FULL_36_35 TaxID=1802578 RepID=A0A1F4S9E7_UNCSA|nr:MAG: hypothetical protein A2230_01695 [candidate division WOR-1 bacterium RIFOXYA2_FULL_36_21]OGC15710.1 MAG: hypothetical protein A2282_04350 [candidate division WOR-1 bacterium RIFOXYA12_FULL_36_13]OGC16363.1 MAG: hypothetical protein A2290_04420 [candidate division WOR-1 bacterium RIFOXYB2_FULL_36_35]